MGFFSTLGHAITDPFAQGFKTISNAAAEPDSTKQQRANLVQQGNSASGFADQGQQQFGALGTEGGAARQMLLDRANGKSSLSAEQLRQGLQQQYGQQRSMAASAAPRDASMAARTAAMNMGRAGYGMSGQAALAGIQERNSAMDQYAALVNAMRQQELQAALQSRQNAVSAYGGGTPEKSQLEQYAPLINGLTGAFGAGGK